MLQSSALVSPTQIAVCAAKVFVYVGLVEKCMASLWADLGGRLPHFTDMETDWEDTNWPKSHSWDMKELGSDSSAFPSRFIGDWLWCSPGCPSVMCWLNDWDEYTRALSANRRRNFATKKGGVGGRQELLFFLSPYKVRAQGERGLREKKLICIWFFLLPFLPFLSSTEE